jgi:prevent-host-death family protein
MRSVGIRELKQGLSAVLARVKKGEAVIVTDRRQPVAVVVPLRAGGTALIERLARAGRLSWAGGKPRGAKRPPRVQGPSVADAVIEDRR